MHDVKSSSTQHQVGWAEREGGLQQLERGGTAQPAPGPVQDSGAGAFGAGAFPDKQEPGPCPCVQGSWGCRQAEHCCASRQIA